MRTVFAICWLLAAATVSAQAYRWVDENGVVHYSDRPTEGAEQVELEVRDTGFTSLLSESAPATDTPAPTEAAATSTTASPATPPATTEYERLEIVRPQQGETLWNIGAVMTVALRLSPSLDPSHRLYLIYDGIRLTGLPTNQLDIALNEVYRGEHTLRAQVEDIDGNVLQQSSTRRFYVQQATIRR
ncbi:MAG: DUF4124 domain-containing protein [Pseudomonadota bacterium]